MQLSRGEGFDSGKTLMLFIDFETVVNPDG